MDEQLSQKPRARERNCKKNSHYRINSVFSLWYLKFSWDGAKPMQDWSGLWNQTNNSELQSFLMQHRPICLRRWLVKSRAESVWIKESKNLNLFAVADQPASKLASQPVSSLGICCVHYSRTPLSKPLWILMITVHPNRSKHTHIHARAHTLSRAHSTVFAPGVLTKQETVGTRQKTAMPVRSTCSQIFTPGGAWRHCHHTTSVSMPHQHTHTNTHRHMPTFSHTHTVLQCIHSHVLISYLFTSTPFSP